MARVSLIPAPPPPHGRLQASRAEVWVGVGVRRGQGRARDWQEDAPAGRRVVAVNVGVRGGGEREGSGPQEPEGVL